MRRFPLAVLWVLACGGEQPAHTLSSNAEPVTVVQSPFGGPGLPHVSVLHCDTEPIDNGNGTSTQLSCPFEQQLWNIRANGTAVSSGQLLSQGQAVAFTSSAVCGDWVMGADSGGVLVFISTVTGTVRSHGTVHSGFPVTILPPQLALPVTLNH